MQPRRHSATLLILRAQCLFALVGIIAKLLGDYADAVTTSCWLLVIVTAMLLVNSAVHKELGGLRHINWWLAIVRGGLVFGLTLLNIYAFQNLPLTEAFALSFLVPLFQVPLSIIVLHEKIGWHRRLAPLAGFGGVLVMLRPEFAAHDQQHLLADAAMIASAAMSALNFTLMRHAFVHQRPISVGPGVLATELVSAALCLIFFAHPLASALSDAHLMAGLMLFATVTAIAIISNAEAYRRAEASYLAPFGYIQLLWAALAGWLFWHEVPNRYTCLGAALIIGSGLYTIHRERVLAARKRQTALKNQAKEATAV